MIFGVVRGGVRRLFGGGKIDGVLDLGDIGVALAGAIAISFLIAFLGFGVELFLCVSLLSTGPFSFRGTLTGFSLGVILGSVLGAMRIVVDLAHRNENGSTIFSPSEEVFEEQVPDPPGPAPAFGIRVEVHQGSSVLMAHLLPERDRESAARTFRRIAFAVIRKDWKFSKRQAGQFLGDDLRETRDELYRLGLVVKTGTASNASFEVTDQGRAFLELCLTDHFPNDPFVIRTD